MDRGIIEQKHIDKLRDFGINIDDASEIELLKFSKGETLLREGMPMSYLLFVLSGKAKVFASADNGRDLLLSYYVEDGVIGDVELMIGVYSASTTMVAMTPFTCIALPYHTWSHRLKNNLVFLNYIGKELAEKLLFSSNKGVVTILHDGKKRLCQYLLQITPEGVLEENITNISSAIGLSYRQTLRILKDLCTDKIIEKHGGVYKVLNREALREKGFSSF